MSDEQPQDAINFDVIASTLLRIVAHLEKTQYTVRESNGHNRRQAAELELDDLPDPASDESTSQG